MIAISHCERHRTRLTISSNTVIYVAYNLSMNQLGIEQSLAEATEVILIEVAGFVPRLLAAVLLLFVGLIISNWARWLVIKLFQATNLVKLVKGSPVDKFLEKTELRLSMDKLLGGLVKWFSLYGFFIIAANIVGLSALSDLLIGLFSFVPRLIAALLIIILGTLLAGVVESLVKASLSQVSLSSSRLISRITSYIVMLFAVLAAVAQLGIAETFINILFVGVVAMLALAFGLAIGLGAKDLVAKILDEWYSNLKKSNQ